MSEPHEKIYKSRHKIFIDNFIGGIGWALGATLGTALVLGIIGIILKQINVIPFIGNFVIDTQKFIEQNSMRR